MNFIKIIFTCLSLFILMIACADDDGLSDFTKSENFKILGSSSQDLLSSNKFSRLKVEILYDEGYAPSAFTISSLKNFLEQRLHKSSITIDSRSILKTESTSLSLEDFIQIEQNHRSTFNTNDEISVFIYFAHAKHINDTFDSDQFTLGTAYLNTSIIIFGQTIEKVSKSLTHTKLEIIESAAVQHEFSHLLGLVNNNQVDIPDTSAIPRHCINTDCLMSSNILFSFNLAKHGNSPDQLPTLDENCLMKLKRLGGK